MKYLIHYNYYKNGERMFDWAWSEDNATKNDLLELIEQIKEQDKGVKFHGVYGFPNSPESILYFHDGTVKL